MNDCLKKRGLNVDKCDRNDWWEFVSGNEWQEFVRGNSWSIARG